MSDLARGIEQVRIETRQVQQHLSDLGFAPGSADGIEGPLTRTAVARFQLAYTIRPLRVDAIAGPQTWAALTECVGNAGLIAPNFRVDELRSRGDRTCFIHRDILRAVQHLRNEVGRPLIVRSAWRDPAHNTAVGGARTSQHTYGAAPELTEIRVRLSPQADLTAGRAIDFDRGYVTLDDVRDMRLFTGIGYRQDGRTNWVTHVDVRADRTPQNPAVWQYK